jgi:hypothetical protein
MPAGSPTKGRSPRVCPSHDHGMRVHVLASQYVAEEVAEQFFVFDPLDDLATASSPHDSIVLLDCDVIWTCSERTRGLWSELRAAGRGRCTWTTRPIGT